MERCTRLELLGTNKDNATEPSCSVSEVIEGIDDLEIVAVRKRPRLRER